MAVAEQPWESEKDETASSKLDFKVRKMEFVVAGGVSWETWKHDEAFSDPDES